MDAEHKYYREIKIKPLRELEREIRPPAGVEPQPHPPSVRAQPLARLTRWEQAHRSL